MNPPLFRLLIIGFGVFYTINHFFIINKYLNGFLWIVATVGSGAVVIYNNYQLNKREQERLVEDPLFDKCFILSNNLSPEEKDYVDQQVKDLEAIQPLSSTQQLIEIYKKLYLESPFLKAMGAVGPGTECAVPKMYMPIIEGLKKQNQFTEDQLKFFSLHLPIDEKHCNMICNALTPYMDDENNQKLVREGALEALESRKLFWDGLEKAILVS